MELIIFHTFKSEVGSFYRILSIMHNIIMVLLCLFKLRKHNGNVDVSITRVTFCSTYQGEGENVDYYVEFDDGEFETT